MTENEKRRTKEGKKEKVKDVQVEVKMKHKKEPEKRKWLGLEGVVKLLGVFSSLYVGLNYILNRLYQNECEQRYYIPGEFFTLDIRPKVAYVVLSILLLVICMYPAFGRIIDSRYVKGKQKKSVVNFYVILSSVMGILLGLVNIVFLFDISFVYTILSKSRVAVCGTIMVVLLCSIGAIAGMTLAQEIERLKRKGIVIGYIVWYAMMFVTIGIFVSGVVYKLEDAEKDNEKYEFVLNAENDYVVLSEIDDTILVVEYIEEDGEYTFFTGAYEFLERKQYRYKYVTINSELEIKDIEKPTEENEDELGGCVED